MPAALRRFLHTEAAGGLVLLAASVVALLWANSPWAATYQSFWHTPVQIRAGSIGFQGDLQHFVNDGLMTLFFFVVGLEIKRELVVGELRRWRTAALPAIAAVGGMVVPALLYLSVNAGEPGARGWGVPMATDIAFAVGVLAILGPRVPASLKLFLLTLAIVDDVGVILIIAVFYSASIHFLPLALAAGLIGAMACLRRARMLWMPLHVILGVGVWVAAYESGIHPTLAGAVLGLLASARPLAPVTVAREWAQDLSDEPPTAELRAMTRLATHSVSQAERLEHALHPLTSFVVVPLFALANAGLRLEADALNAPGGRAVVLGVVLGLVGGKTLGVVGASWLAVRLRVGDLPEGVRWPQLVGVAAIAGVGFTVSLFVAGLAFSEPSLQAAAKLGIVTASALASLLGVLVLLASTRGRHPGTAAAPP